MAHRGSKRVLGVLVAFPERISSRALRLRERTARSVAGCGKRIACRASGYRDRSAGIARAVRNEISVLLLFAMMPCAG